MEVACCKKVLKIKCRSLRIIAQRFGNLNVLIVQSLEHRWRHECLLQLMLYLRGPVPTAHQSLSVTDRSVYALCIAAFHNRSGKHIPVVRMTLRAELSALRQEEDESLDTFGDHAYALTAQAYPYIEDNVTPKSRSAHIPERH